MRRISTFTPADFDPGITETVPNRGEYRQIVGARALVLDQHNHIGSVVQVGGTESPRNSQRALTRTLAAKLGEGILLGQALGKIIEHHDHHEITRILYCYLAHVNRGGRLAHLGLSEIPGVQSLTLPRAAANIKRGLHPLRRGSSFWLSEQFEKARNLAMLGAAQDILLPTPTRNLHD